MEIQPKPTPEQALNLLVQVASMSLLNMQDNEKVRISIGVLTEAIKPKTP